MNDDMLHIPVRATYQIIDGKAVQVAAEYADIPATVVAEFIMQRLGIDAIEEAKP